ASAEDVRFEDRCGRAELVAMENLANEPGHVDVGRAGAGAGCIVAKEAPRSLGAGLIEAERRRDVGETGLQLVIRQALTGSEPARLLARGWERAGPLTRQPPAPAAFADEGVVGDDLPTPAERRLGEAAQRPALIGAPIRVGLHRRVVDLNPALGVDDGNV